MTAAPCVADGVRALERRRLEERAMYRWRAPSASVTPLQAAAPCTERAHAVPHAVPPWTSFDGSSRNGKGEHDGSGGKGPYPPGALCLSIASHDRALALAPRPPPPSPGATITARAGWPGHRRRVGSGQGMPQRWRGGEERGRGIGLWRCIGVVGCGGPHGFWEHRKPAEIST